MNMYHYRPKYLGFQVYSAMQVGDIICLHTSIGLLTQSIQSTELEQMEFRILHHIFCDEYKIKENACPFDKYAEMCYEKYLMYSHTP